jgi:hypothetical protein
MATKQHILVEILGDTDGVAAGTQLKDPTFAPAFHGMKTMKDFDADLPDGGPPLVHLRWTGDDGSSNPTQSILKAIQAQVSADTGNIVVIGLSRGAFNVLELLNNLATVQTIDKHDLILQDLSMVAVIETLIDQTSLYRKGPFPDCEKLNYFQTYANAIAPNQGFHGSVDSFRDISLDPNTRLSSLKQEYDGLYAKSVRGKKIQEIVDDLHTTACEIGYESAVRMAMSYLKV